MDYRESAPEDACLITTGTTNQSGGSEHEGVEPDDFCIEGLPEGYVYIHHRRIISIMGKGEATPLCGPLRVTRRLSSLNGDAAALVIEFLDRDDTQRTYVAGVDDLIKRGSDVVADLANRGLVLRGTVTQLLKFVRSWEVGAVGSLAKHKGWMHADDQVGYISQSGKALTCSGPGLKPIFTLGGSADVSAARAGSFEGWRNGVAAMANNNPLLMFSIACALTGPLLEIFNLDGTGFNIHGRTSDGKTTILNAAASVSGPPAAIMRWNATPTAFENAARDANDGTLIIDEIPTKNNKAARDLGPVLYMLGNGVARSRSDFSLKSLAPATWRIVLLTSAEASLTEIFATAKLAMPDGLGVRLADIPTKSWAHGAFADIHGYPNAADFADALKAACREHHGHAGERFIRNLINTRQSSPKLKRIQRLFELVLKELTEYLGSRSDTPIESAEQRVIRQFAAVSVAAQLACAWQIVPWSLSSVRPAIAEIACLWLNQRRQHFLAPSEGLLARVKEYFDAHRGEFADFAGGEDFAPGQHSGWHDDETLAISTEVFADQIAHPLPRGVAARLLMDIGVLSVGGEARSLQQRRPQRMEPKRGREYHLSKSHLGLARSG
jgi:putative DNA primase/helicase